MLRRKLTIAEANKVHRLAYEDKKRCTNANVRLGQALMNNLPADIYEDVTGTELDMFNFEDDEVAENFFFNHFV